MVGRANLIGDPRFATAEQRVQNSAAIGALLAAWCSERTKIEAMDLMQGAGVPAGAVFDTRDLTADPHLRKSGLFATIEHPVRGALTIPAWPVSLSASRVPTQTAPLLGAHTDELLSEWLADKI